jgi:hypothetical protein
MSDLPTTISLTARDPVRSKSTMTSSVASGAVPMSMPAILGAKGKYAHLYAGKTQDEIPKKVKKEKTVDSLANSAGKRRRRRYENGASLYAHSHCKAPRISAYGPHPCYQHNWPETRTCTGHLEPTLRPVREQSNRLCLRHRRPRSPGLYTYQEQQRQCQRQVRQANSLCLCAGCARHYVP